MVISRTEMKEEKGQQRQTRDNNVFFIASRNGRKRNTQVSCDAPLVVACAHHELVGGSLKVI